MINNLHIGSSLDDLFEEDGVLEEVEAIAKKRVLAWQSNQSKLLVQRVKIGALEVDGFMLPDGSYRLSQTQAAECVGMTERNASEFLDSKTFKRLTGDDYTPAIFEIESETQTQAQSRFRALPLEIVVIYWVYQCYRGNKQALNLLVALANETLEGRFDKAFGATRTQQEN